jgi:hypothetical protein
MTMFCMATGYPDWLWCSVKPTSNGYATWAEGQAAARGLASEEKILRR